MANQHFEKREDTEKKYPLSLLVAILAFTIWWYYGFVYAIVNYNGKQIPPHPMAAGYYLVYFLPFVMVTWIYVQLYRYLLFERIKSASIREVLTITVFSIGIIQYCIRTVIQNEINDLSSLLTTPVIVDSILWYVSKLRRKVSRK
ncbi:MAG: hypothetical protein U0Y96_08695 [Candidatus Kapaibacterium sp.]